MATGIRIAVAGARGFVGSALVLLLEAHGHEVVTIGRHGPAQPVDVEWDPRSGEIDRAELEGIDAAINLAGERIDQRWSADARRRIVESRVQPTDLLARTMASLSPRPRVLVNMSAVGFYGDRGDEDLDESSSAGKGFLAGVVDGWEAATRPASDAGIRVVCARSGVILHPGGSILARLIPIFQFGVGGVIGSGRQWISWISRTDAVRALEALVRDESSGGAVNVTAPAPVPNAEFVRVLARVLHRPAIAPVPAFAVKLLYGRMGEETVLGGQRVLPRRLLASGFRFSHPDLKGALRHELGEG